MCRQRSAAAGGCCTGRSLSLLTDFGCEFARIRTSLDLALFGRCGATSNRSHGSRRRRREDSTLEGTWSCFQGGVLAKMSIPLLLRSTLPPLFLFSLLLFRSAAILGTPWCLLATRPFHGSLGRISFFRCQKKKKVEYFKSVAGATHGDIIHLLYHRNYRPWHGFPNLTQGYLRPVSYLQFVELHFSPCHRFPNLTSQRLVG